MARFSTRTGKAVGEGWLGGRAALRLLPVLIAVLALGTVDAARAQTVTLALVSTAIDEDGGSTNVTATVSPAATAPFTVEVSGEVRVNGRFDRFASVGRVTYSTNTTLSFAANATESTGTVTVTAVANDGHTERTRNGVTVELSGVVAGVTGVDDPDSVTLTINENDGTGSSTDRMRPTATGGTVNGNSAVLTFDEAMHGTTSLRETLFRYRVNGGVELRPASVGTPDGTTLALTLQEPVEREDAVLLRYFPARHDNLDIDLERSLRDVAGNPVYRFNGVRLTNMSPPRVQLVLTPAMASEGDIVRVTATLLAPAPSAFAVTVSVSPNRGVALSTNTTLSFAQNATESTGEVLITALDNDREGRNPDVTVSAAFEGATPTGVLEARDATLTIRDDEAPDEVDDQEEDKEDDQEEDQQDGQEDDQDQDQERARPAVPPGWLARFGKIAAGHAVDALGERFQGGMRSPHAKLAGRRIGDWQASGPAAGVRSMSGAELLRDSSFLLTLGAAESKAASGPRWTVWGRGAAGRFDGRDGGHDLDGDTATFALGWDADLGRVLAGLAIAHSDGDGGFAIGGPCTGESCTGDLEGFLVGIYPYLRVQVTDRLSAWAILGHGAGRLTLDPDGDGASGNTEMTMNMGALGAYGALLPAGAGGGFELGLKSDAMFVQMSSSRAQAMAASDADIQRLRLAIVASGSLELPSAVVTPSAEIGLRRDTGDAETGTGVELAGAIRYAHPPSGLTVEWRVRTLVAHDDEDYREWDLSGAVRLDPDASGRGPSLALVPGWSSTAAAGLDAEMGYGVAVMRGGALVTPYAGLSMQSAQCCGVRLGGRLELGPDATLGLEGVRRPAAGEAAREHRFLLSGSLRW